MMKSDLHGIGYTTLEGTEEIISSSEAEMKFKLWRLDATQTG